VANLDVSPSRACELTGRCLAVVQIWEDTPGCGDTAFLDSLWTAMDEAVTLKDCDVYSYKSDGEDDPFGAPSPRRLAHSGAISVSA